MEDDEEEEEVLSPLHRPSTVPMTERADGSVSAFFPGTAQCVCTESTYSSAHYS